MLGKWFLPSPSEDIPSRGSCQIVSAKDGFAKLLDYTAIYSVGWPLASNTLQIIFLYS